MARLANQHGSTLSRVVFKALDGMWQLTVLCGGCLSSVIEGGREVRYLTRPYGQGPGECEFCAHEIRAEVGL